MTDYRAKLAELFIEGGWSGYTETALDALLAIVHEAQREALEDAAQHMITCGTRSPVEAIVLIDAARRVRELKDKVGKP